MSSAGALHTKKTWSQLTVELLDEFRKWGVGREEVQVPILKNAIADGGVSVKFVPPKGKTWQSAACSHFPSPAYNLYAIVEAVRYTRLMDQRGVGGVLAQVTAHLALPASTIKATRSPEEIIGIKPGMGPKQQIDQYRAALFAAHPDQGGTSAELIAVREAAAKLGII